MITPFDDSPIEDEQLAGTEEDNDGFDEQQATVCASEWLKRFVYPVLGMDTPDNHAKIVEFMVNDVKESQPDTYKADDFSISFKKFIETTPVKKYRH